MRSLKDKDELAQCVRETPIVIVEIGSIRCCACSAIAQKLAARYDDAADVCCCTLSLEAAADTCAALGIYSAPAVLVYVDGRLTVREAGVMSVEDIIRRVERYRTLMTESEAMNDV